METNQDESAREEPNIREFKRRNYCIEDPRP